MVRGEGSAKLKGRKGVRAKGGLTDNVEQLQSSVRSTKDASRAGEKSHTHNSRNADVSPRFKPSRMCASVCRVKRAFASRSQHQETRVVVPTCTEKTRRSRIPRFLWTPTAPPRRRAHSFLIDTKRFFLCVLPCRFPLGVSLQNEHFFSVNHAPRTIAHAR